MKVSVGCGSKQKKGRGPRPGCREALKRDPAGSVESKKARGVL